MVNAPAAFFRLWIERCGLRTFARKFSNIDFFLKILPSKDDELVMSEMYINGGGGGGSPTSFWREHTGKNT